MKTLQNNFTTQEQSKRLLEIGVPADSADCYYMAIGFDAKKYGYSDFPYFMTTNYVDKVHVIKGVNIPCWSVGRLMEIYLICCNSSWHCVESDSLIKDILYEFENNELDFSKLKD